MPLRKGLIKYDGAIYKKSRICTVTQKKKCCMVPRAKTRLTQGQTKKRKEMSEARKKQ